MIEVKAIFAMIMNTHLPAVRQYLTKYGVDAEQMGRLLNKDMFHEPTFEGTVYDPQIRVAIFKQIMPKLAPLARTAGDLKHLPEIQQVALLLIQAGCSYEETADTIGIPTGTVKSRVSRARNTLKKFAAKAQAA